MKNCMKLIAILVLSLFVFSPGVTRAEGIEEGSEISDFTLADGLTGETVTFSKHIKGKTKYTAIIFANSSCGACRKELATLSKLSESSEDFKTYVILVDMKGAEIIKAFSTQFNYNVTYLLDPDFSVPPLYGFYFTPSLIIIDDKGVITYKKGGYNINQDEEIISKKVNELLK